MDVKGERELVDKNVVALIDKFGKAEAEVGKSLNKYKDFSFLKTVICSRRVKVMW